MSNSELQTSTLSEVEGHLEQANKQGLPKGWKKCNLGYVLSSNLNSIGKNYPYQKIEYLDTGSITNNKIESFQSFDIKDAPSRAKRLVKHQNIIYSTVRPIQRHFGFIENPQENLVVSTGFSVLDIDKNLASPKFIYYFLSSNEVVEELDAIAEGATSAYPSLKPSDIESLEINLPPLAEQKAIAEVLSSLDDKIDLLHKQNHTLEDMAQTLFREWFIEKADEGWEEVPLSEVVYHRKDNVKPQNTPSGLFKHYSLPSFDNGKVPISETGSDIRSNKYRLYSYSILVSKLNPKTPRVWDIYFEVEDNEICSTEFQILQPKKKEYFPFVSMFLKSNEATDILSMSASGTSGSHQRVTAKDMLSLKILKPCDSVILSFSEAVSPSFEKIHKNKKQIKALEQTRDTLLPKLMSGQVRV
ncbi:restriction endonuclease subunit S [Francisella philomiragia]|uniref:Type I restriction modification DNA specificity domain protein n=1 Tax=Francisella philomiragia TaxID=28110 RepID=A0A0B6D5A7_9GAMM|nr:restriction endonuclease subunit S [Francisella philomiragia]AJI54076.1 type I restriction modification DNA specificity domain protein [Francisella philomiragia]